MSDYFNTKKKCCAYSWDALVLSLYWPPALCSVLGENCLEERVQYIFTIHGLWPILKSGDELPSKYGSPDYKWFGRLYYPSLFWKLSLNWPNYQAWSSDNIFWMHEWDTHGRYSHALFNQTQYFTKALELYGMHNIFFALWDAGMVPGNVALLQKARILEAMRRSTNFYVGLQCVQVNGNKVLTEVRLCFNADGTSMIDCPSVIGGSCPEKDILYIS